uniref:enoyl-CoA hydratase n=1 Tax=Panagrellus redivivus TaxID=6233 RepID=A0A7E4W327_PANRE
MALPLFRRNHNTWVSVLRTSGLSSASAHRFIKSERVGPKQDVGLITLNSRRTFNALSTELMAEVGSELRAYDKDPAIGAVVVASSSPKVFSAGASIHQFLQNDFLSVYEDDFFKDWISFNNMRKPIIAAVNGYAFGGGCELALTCDIIYAGKNALFSQPEVLIGTVPGAGGTQRLPRVAGKSLSMEMCLTGDRITADEALRRGMISKVFPSEDLTNEAVKLGAKIAGKPPLLVRMIKESVSRSFENFLESGTKYERFTMHSTFALEDRKNAISALPEESNGFKDE